MFDILERIKHFALPKGISVCELGRLSGLHPTTLYAAKYKGSESKLSTIESVCGVLGISLAEFFDIDGEYARKVLENNRSEAE